MQQVIHQCRWNSSVYMCLYICISSVKMYLLGPVFHVFWPNVLPKLFQVKLHASARQSNLLQPRKKLQVFVWLLWIFSFDCSFKTVIVISKLELLAEIALVSVFTFYPTFSSNHFFAVFLYLDWEAIHWWPSGASHPNARPAVPSYNGRWDSAVISMVLSNQKHSKKKHFQILFSLLSWCQWCHSFLSLPLAMAKKTITLQPFMTSTAPENSVHQPEVEPGPGCILACDFSCWQGEDVIQTNKRLLLEQFAGAS